MEYNYAIEALLTEKELLVDKLKSNENSEVDSKKIGEINNAIKWLNKISELGFADITKYEVVELPDLNTGYSEYRIMNDCETDNIETWIEFKDHIGLAAGDFIISRKQ